MAFKNVKSGAEYDPVETLPPVFTLVSHQFEYINHLEKENSMIEVELNNIKQRLAEVINENQAIHDAARSESILKTIDESNHLMNIAKNQKCNKNEETVVKELSPKKTCKELDGKYSLMKQDLEKMQEVYISKVGGLEAHLKAMENTLTLTLEENVQLKKKVESTQNVSNMPMFQATNTSLIERLTSEKNALLKTVSSQRTYAKNIQEQETVLRVDLQKSLEALEDLQLQNTEVMVEKKQLLKDLDVARNKLNKEIMERQSRILDVTSQQKQHFSSELDNKQKKIGELLATCAHFEDVIKKSGEEKERISLQLEESRVQLFNVEKEMFRLQAEIKGEVKTSLKGYTAAEQELREARNKLDQQLTISKQEQSRCEQQNKDLHKRLLDAENLVLKLQETNVKLSRQFNESLTELSALKQKYKNSMQSLQTKHCNMQLTSCQKIKELQNSLEATDFEYSERLKYVEDVSTKQAKLISKLRNECQTLGTELLNLTCKYRKEIGMLAQKNEKLTINTHRLALKNKELSEQCVEHGLTHRVMHEQLSKLSSRAHISSNQVLELLDKQAQLLQSKEVLNKEVKFLESQVLP